MDFKSLFKFNRAHRYFSLLLAFNCFLIALVVYAWSEGHVATVFAADQTGFMIHLIGTIGTMGIVFGLFKSWQVSCGQTDISASYPIMRLFPEISTGLGILGTVWGIILMSKNIAASGGTATIIVVMGGLNLALYTTLVGLFFALWIMANNAVVNSQTIYRENHAGS